jgi:hypothetical protein
MFKAPSWFAVNFLLAACLAGSAGLAAVSASPGQQSKSTGSHPAVVASSVTNERQAVMLRRRWGIDEVHVRSTASGAVVRFSYRVVDAEKAKMLNDKRVEPYLLVKKSGARLEVPSTEKIGKLRQTPPPENGREYWMVFANAGRALVPGDHVQIVLGTFRADELLVESPR